MLRRCCLCTRQLELSTSSHQPVASTSTHIFRTSPSNAKRSKQHAKRTFSSKAIELPTHETENLFEKQPPSGGSLWKGKARAIELPPPPPRAFRRPEDTPRISAEVIGPTGTASSSSQGAVSDLQTIEPDTAEHYLEKAIREGDAPRALLALLETYVPLASVTASFEDALKRDLRRILQACPGQISEEDVQMRLQSAQGSGSNGDDVAILTRLATLCMRVARGQHTSNIFRNLMRTTMAASPVNAVLVRSLITAVIEAYTTRQRWNAIAELGLLSHELLGEWHPPILEYYLRAVISIDREGRAPTSSALPHHLPVSTYNQLVKAHLRNRNLSEARKIFQHMQINNVQPARSTYQAILEGYRTLGASHSLYRALLGTVQQLGFQLDTGLVNMFIECSIGAGNLAGAHELLQMFSNTFNAPPQLLTAGSSVLPLPQPPAGPNPHMNPHPPRPASPSSSIHVMTSYSTPVLEPNAETFALLVRGYTSFGDLDKALDLYTEMLDQGFSPSPLLVSAIRRAFTSAGRRNDFDAVVAEVEGPRGDLEDRNAPLAIGKQEGSEAYHSQLKDLLRTRGLVGLREVVDRMTEDGLRLKDRAITWILTSLSRHVDATKLAQLAENLREAHGSSIALSDFNVLVHSFTKREVRLGASFPPSPSSDPLLFPSFYDSRHQTPSDYLSLVRNLHESGVSPDAYTSAIFMQQFADSRGSPRILWDYFRWQILDRGIQPNGYHIAALMTAYCKAGDLYGARRAMERGEGLGVYPSIHHYTILLSYAASKDKQTVVEALLSQMQERGIQPDLPVYATLASMSARHGLIKQVRATIARAQRELSDLNWPNPVLETIAFHCRNIRREWTLAQVILSEALEAGLVPDRVLMRVAGRVAAGHRNNRNGLTAKGEDTSRLDEALVFAQANLAQMKEIVRQAREKEQLEGGGAVTMLEISKTLQSILHNREMTTSH